MTQPTSAPFFSLAMMNPFVDPAKAAVDRFHPNASTNIKDRAIALYQKETPALLRNKPLRILIVSVIYLAGLIFIPIILRFTYFNNNISTFQAKRVTKQIASIAKATALIRQRIATRSTPDPIARNRSPNSQIDTPRAPRPRADSASSVASLPGSAMQSPPPPAHMSANDLNDLADNIFTQHSEKKHASPSTLHFYKTPAEQEEIFDGLTEITDSREKLAIIDKLLYIEDLVFATSEEILSFIANLKRVAYEASMTLATSHRDICAPQDIYTDTSCPKGDANGSCGSSALAFLAGSPDPIKLGFTMHKQYKFDLITQHADLTEDLIGKNPRVQLHNKHAKIEDINLDFPIFNRYNELLEQIPLGTKGLLQVGGKFLAIEKHTNRNVELFDSHGKPYPHSLDKTNDMSKAYSATFQNSQAAALFLSVNRRPSTNPAVQHVIEFTPIQFTSGTTAFNLADNSSAPSPSNQSRLFLQDLADGRPGGRERSDSEESLATTSSGGSSDYVDGSFDDSFEEGFGLLDSARNFF